MRGAAKEAEAAKAKQNEQEGTGAKKQAHPLTLALVGSLEDTTCDEELPAFHRAYAWYLCFRL